ncbi:F-box protein [Beauveria bassiana ARSEF 2860]|uniref:F-box protein n=1 Tax=Beauveria bassiana (strain ARSEF 2860) TaxID=655819 RepID=J4UUS7_BEAB2|nr:F-box protein [Beauveria bassiana ARSEF 2860]EJP69772.1 F-box protein [Beauveria bassiana ARSEF 2860]
MQYIIGGTKHDDAVVTKCIFKEPILSVALDNGEVHVLNVENEETMVLHGHASAVWALESDGGRIASGDSGESPEIRMWNLMQGGACTHVLKGHRATIRALQLLSDGNTLVSASKDGIIKVWSLEKSECIQELSAHEGAVRCLGVDQSRHLLVSGSSDRTVRVWDLKNGFNCERVLRGHVGTIFCLGVQSEKGIVASGGEKGMLMLWNIEDGVICSLQFFNYGIAGRHSTGYISTWSLEPTIGLTASVASHLPGATCSDAAGNYIVSGGKDHQIKIWCPQESSEPITLSPKYLAIWAVALVGSNRVAVAASRDGFALVEMLSFQGR